MKKILIVFLMGITILSCQNKEKSTIKGDAVLIGSAAKTSARNSGNSSGSSNSTTSNDGSFLVMNFQKCLDKKGRVDTMATIKAFLFQKKNIGKMMNYFFKDSFGFAQKDVKDVKLPRDKNVIYMQKGEKIDIGLTKINVEFSWTPNDGTTTDLDLDLSAFMINEKRLIPQEAFFVFYGNVDSPARSLHYRGNNFLGDKGEVENNETIEVDLSMVSSRIHEIVFVATINEAIKRKQAFSHISNAYIRIIDDARGLEIARYELGADFFSETVVELGRLFRKDGKWKFEAYGIGYKQDLTFLLSKYYKTQLIN